MLLLLLLLVVLSVFVEPAYFFSGDHSRLGRVFRMSPKEDVFGIAGSRLLQAVWYSIVEFNVPLDTI